MLRTLDFALQRALANMRRHSLMSVAATSTIAVTLSIVGAAGLALLNVNAWTRTAVSEVEIYVYARRDLSRADALALQRRISALPHVVHTEFVPREAGLRRFQESYHFDPGLFEGVGNPLPDAIHVRTDDAGRVAAVAATVATWPAVRKVVHAESTIRILLTVRRIVTRASVGAGVLLTLAAMLIVHNTIRLALLARRREIGIMQLVGATPAFVAAPFLLEGVFYGLAGALIALCVLVPGYVWARHALARILTLFPLAPLSVLVDCGVLLVIGGLLAAGLATAVSLTRFLRKSHPT
ncbi:MAG TPA: permease-like cell division protein FtsX [Armatimonadota bacterium]|nr:permease-like cell division protein FtsX [Armatimonadota bacterium]